MGRYHGYMENQELPDDDYVLSEGAAWFTVGVMSVRIHRDRAGGLTISVYKLGEEMDDPIDFLQVW